jgi:hypothetical protein
MNIIERLEQEAKRHPGATGEGVRIALKVLQECTCGTCEHLEPNPDGQTFVACGIGCIEDPDDDEDFCSRWEARQ